MQLIYFAVFRVYKYCFYLFICHLFILFLPCFYRENNCSVSRFYFILRQRLIAFSDIFIFMFSIQNRNFKSLKYLLSLYTIIFPSIITMTLLNCCKLFWWFYNADTEDTVIVSFYFLIFINCFQLLFVLIILEVQLIVCLDSVLLTLFLHFFNFQGYNLTL